MKQLFIAALLCAAPVFAADNVCQANCAETVKQCKEVCKTSLKKNAADKIQFCQDKCKEFENECRQDCNKPDDDHH